MKYSRELIIRKAFDVFWDKGYDSTSISVLQEELGMSRGAMYRYFKNKEELFVAVIDQYFFRIYERIIKYLDADLTAKEMIDILHRRHRLYAIVFVKSGMSQTAFLNYTALLIQAAKNYPNFIRRVTHINQGLKDCWQRALRNSIEKKQVRKDIDVNILSTLFINASLKESSDCNDSDTSTFAAHWMRELDGRKKIMDYLYTLIQI